MTGSTIAAVVAQWRSTPQRTGNRRIARPLAESSVNRRIACLQRAWRRAEDLWGWQLARIAWGRLKGTEPEPRDRSVPVDLRGPFMDALPPRSRWLYAMGFYTGLRRGALLALTAQSFDWQAGVIHAYSKGRGPQGKYTPKPITNAVCEIMMAVGRLPESGPIFQVTFTMLRRDVAKAAAATGYRITMHQTRHSIAQDAEDAGEGDIIQTLLDHSTPNLRKRYSRTRLERQAEVLERMQEKRK